MGKFFLCFFVCIFSLSGCAYGPYNTSGRVVLQDDHGMIDIAFSDHDRQLIHDYYYGGKYKKKRKGLPPGLAKKDKLPPGIQKQLVRKGQLPPGLEYRRLPNDLERRLSHLPNDYARAMVGGSFVLFNEHTQVIFDVMHDF